MVVLIFMMVLGNEVVAMGQHGTSFTSMLQCKETAENLIKANPPPLGKKIVYRCEFVPATTHI